MWAVWLNVWRKVEKGEKRKKTKCEGLAFVAEEKRKEKKKEGKWVGLVWVGCRGKVPINKL